MIRNAYRYIVHALHIKELVEVRAREAHVGSHVDDRAVHVKDGLPKSSSEMLICHSLSLLL